MEVSSHLHAMRELGGELLFEMIHGFISKEEDENTPLSWGVAQVSAGLSGKRAAGAGLITSGHEKPVKGVRHVLH